VHLTNDGPLYPTDRLASKRRQVWDAGVTGGTSSSARGQVRRGISTGAGGIVGDDSDRVEGVPTVHAQKTTDRDDRRPLAGTDAASAPPCSGFTLRDRTWLPGATDRADRAPDAGRGLIG
jgi:hypothetical protein